MIGFEEETFLMHDIVDTLQNSLFHKVWTDGVHEKSWRDSNREQRIGL